MRGGLQQTADALARHRDKQIIHGVRGLPLHPSFTRASPMRRGQFATGGGRSYTVRARAPRRHDATSTTDAPNDTSMEPAQVNLDFPGFRL